MSLFDLYWRLLGLPLSRIKGLATDVVPFSLLECALWFGIASTLVFILSFFFRGGLFAGKRFRGGALLAGPVFLLLVGLGQGALPFTVAPTALREPLTKRLGLDSVTEDSFRAWVTAREARLRENLRGGSAWNDFSSLDEQTVLHACNRSLDTVLATLGLPPGRTVRAFKNMGPLTGMMGIVYGGPAFHDPFFGELAIIRDRDLPAPRHWRLIAVCHETAHGKGFTREMDAEILTQLALLQLPDPRFRILADIHFLRKTGTPVDWPDSLLAEAARVREARRKAEARRPRITLLRDWVRDRNLRNSPVKYGARARGDGWDPRHPFFATVHRASREISDGQK